MKIKDFLFKRKGPCVQYCKERGRACNIAIFKRSLSKAVWLASYTGLRSDYRLSISSDQGLKVHNVPFYPLIFLKRKITRDYFTNQRNIAILHARPLLRPLLLTD